MDTPGVEGEIRPFLVGNFVVQYQFSAVFGWQPVQSPPQMVIQSATPMNSPISTNTIPTGIVGTHLHPFGLRVSQPAVSSHPTWSSLGTIAIPAYSLSAQMFLEIEPPTIPISHYGTARLSSAANYFYANIGPLRPLSLPNDLSGYNSLPTTKQYHPLQPDPTLQLGVEADAIRACQNYIIDPVNKVLFNNSYIVDNQLCRIQTKSEDVHSVPVQSGDTSVNHLSRVDFSWEVLVRGSWYKFAFIEFKRPGALKVGEWSAAFNGNGVVEGAGEKICRQLVKYAYSWNVRFLCTSDWENLVLLHIEGEKPQWFNAQQLADPLEASYVWINDRTKMKRNLYVFLKLALKMCLQNLGIQV